MNERLAACVNVHAPMSSVYRWRETVERERERQLVIKTSRRRIAALTRRLRELHPYELPELIIVPIEGGSDEYLQWIAAQTDEAVERQ